MAALPIKITPAGYAALRNAQGNGTNAVIVAVAGLTSTAFAPGDAVPAEIKRVATIAGGATAADTIHITISDTGTDAYTVRGFGLYLTDGTLLGSYGQAGVIVEKSAQAAMLLAVDIQFADIDATQITFGDTNFSNPQATTERLGVVELATDDETTAGVDTTRAVTPRNLLAALNARLGAGAPSAFVKTLLTTATAAAFRLALGLKSAATFDTGAGNGLDADKLDGKDGAYYQAWVNLTGVPAAFPPAGHTHDAGDITKGTLPVVRGGTGVATLDPGSFLVGAGTGPMVPRTPAQVLADIGAAAKEHSHKQDDIIGLADSLALKADKADLDSKVNKAGDTMTGNLGVAPATGNAAIYLGKAASGVTAMTQASTAGKVRWQFHWANADQEAGGNVGSNLAFDRFDDNGNYIGTAFRIYRATGHGVFPNGIASGASITTDSVAGALDVRTGAGGFIMRTGSFNGTVNEAVLDAVTDNNGQFAALNMRGTQMSFVTTAGSRMMVRGSGTLAIDSVNAANNAFAPMSMTATSFTFSGGSANFMAAINANGGFQSSDRRLKHKIKRRPVTRGLALALAKQWKEWILKSSGESGVGVIAQLVQRLAPHHVREFTHKARNGRVVRRLSIDKAGLALESAMDNTLSLAEQADQIAALSRRIAKLERKHA